VTFVSTTDAIDSSTAAGWMMIGRVPVWPRPADWCGAGLVSRSTEPWCDALFRWPGVYPIDTAFSIYLPTVTALLHVSYPAWLTPGAFGLFASQTLQPLVASTFELLAGIELSVNATKSGYRPVALRDQRRYRIL
jgi:hypothetical protein